MKISRISRSLIRLVLVALVAIAGREGLARAEDAAARALVAKGALLVDVRTAEEYAAGHIEGARNLPVGELGARMGELAPKTRPIVVYCGSGRRSAAAKRTLAAEGFTSIYDLGSIKNW